MAFSIPRPLPSPDDEVGIAWYLYCQAQDRAIELRFRFMGSGSSEHRILWEEAKVKSFQMYKRWYELTHPGHILLYRAGPLDNI